MALNKPLLRELAKNVDQLVNLFLDEKPDSQQIQDILLEVLQVSGQIGSISSQDRKESLLWVAAQVVQLELEK